MLFLPVFLMSFGCSSGSIDATSSSTTTSSTWTTTSTSTSTTFTSSTVVDLDMDGFSEEDGDCDDNDASVYPGADDIPGDGIDQDCDGEDAAIVLEEGRWDVGDVVIVADDCSLSALGDVADLLPTDLLVSNSTVEGFELGEDENIYTCLRDDLSYGCETISEEAPLPDLDAAVGLDIEIFGEIASPSSMSVIYAVDIDGCSGDDCWLVDLVVTFPCYLEVSTSANHSP